MRRREFIGTIIAGAALAASQRWAPPVLSIVEETSTLEFSSVIDVVFAFTDGTEYRFAKVPVTKVGDTHQLPPLTFHPTHSGMLERVYVETPIGSFDVEVKPRHPVFLSGDTLNMINSSFTLTFA